MPISRRFSLKVLCGLPFAAGSALRARAGEDEATLRWRQLQRQRVQDRQAWREQTAQGYEERRELREQWRRQDDDDRRQQREQREAWRGQDRQELRDRRDTRRRERRDDNETLGTDGR